MRPILLLAPDGLVSATVHRLLERAGYGVTVCHDELPPLSAVRFRRPTLIVLAVPAARARAVCLALKTDPVTSRIPVVQMRDESAMDRLTAEPDAVFADLSPPRFLAAVTAAIAVQRSRTREGVHADLRLRVPSDAGELNPLNDCLRGWSTACGLTPLGVHQLTLAVHELVANSMEWGHRYQRSRPVRLHGRLDAEKVSVLVSDSGPGFDRYNLPHAARPGDPVSHLRVRAAMHLRDGGFGILMARGLVDHLCYNEAGTEGLIIQYLRQPRQRPARSGYHLLTDHPG